MVQGTEWQLDQATWREKGVASSYVCWKLYTTGMFFFLH